MNKLLCELILEHGQDIFPYLYVRAKCETFNLDKVAIEYPEIDYSVFERTGLLRVEGSDLVLREDGRWLCDPPEVKTATKKQSKVPYIPQIVQQLANIIGHPMDWAKNPQRYNGQYQAVKRDGFDGDILIEYAEKYKDNRDAFEWESGFELGIFLTKRGLLSIRDFKPVKLETPIWDEYDIKL
jgi:hypothetical protein